LSSKALYGGGVGQEDEGGVGPMSEGPQRRDDGSNPPLSPLSLRGNRGGYLVDERRGRREGRPAYVKAPAGRRWRMKERKKRQKRYKNFQRESSR